MSDKTSELPADTASLRDTQISQLQSLLAEILPTNRFYASKFTDAATLTFPDLDRFKENCPFTTKSELADDQEHNPPYGTTLTYPLERYVRFSQTSGTTGQPIHWLDTAESWSWLLDCKSRIYQSANVTSDDRIFFPFSFGPFLGFWLAFESATRMQALCFPGGGLSSSGRIRTILDQEITVLCCTPTYAIRLADVASEEGFDLSESSVKAIVVGGEPGGSDVNVCHRIESLWPNARVFDHHGMTEVGSVTYGCPARPGILHVIESAYIAEVVDPESLKPILPGETGELVLTNLGRWGSPLIRYRTGDLVRPESAGRCECGTNDLALDGGLLGRLDDMVVVRGVNVFPAAIDRIVRQFDEVVEYRVEICETRGMSELKVLLELDPKTRQRPEIRDDISAALKSSLTLSIPTEIVPEHTLPRFEMKAKRWVRV
jgi:phenylacetate-CoA ligase